jgi:hypothetical protein
MGDKSFSRRTYPVLAAVSRGYSEPKDRFPRVLHPSATPVLLQAFDLHVLGMPPAFVLSQDQTLRLTYLSGLAFACLTVRRVNGLARSSTKTPNFQPER